MDLLIRNLVEEELASVAQLVESLPGVAVDRPSLFWLFFKYFSETCFSALDGGTLCGVVIGFVNQSNPSEAFVYLLAVNKEYWHKGIGSQLLDRFCKAARDKGCNTVVLTAIPENDRANTFYKRQGFDGPVEIMKIGKRRLQFTKSLV